MVCTLRLWENIIRMANVLGCVGASGLGQILYISLSLFQEAQAATVILAMLLTGADGEWLEWMGETEVSECLSRAGSGPASIEPRCRLITKSFRGKGSFGQKQPLGRG
jgi:hypothetical protein